MKLKTLLPAILVIALVSGQLMFGMSDGKSQTAVKSSSKTEHGTVTRVEDRKPKFHHSSASAKKNTARVQAVERAVKHNSKLKGKSFRDGSYTGYGKGFRSTIQLRVTIRNGKITGISVLHSGDDPNYFGRAKAVINRIIRAQSTNVDAVSGATYSSNGIIEAAENALLRAAVNPKSVRKKHNNHKKDQKKHNDHSDTQQDMKIEDGSLQDGIYEGTGEGYAGDTKVRVTVRSGLIEKIDVVSYEDEDDFFQPAREVIEWILQKQKTNVDTVSGATYSSKGIISAVKNALKKKPVKKLPAENSSNTGDNAAIANDESGTSKSSQDSGISVD